MNQFNKAMGGWVALMRKISIVAQARYTVLLPFACAMMAVPVPGSAEGLGKAHQLYGKNDVVPQSIAEWRELLGEDYDYQLQMDQLIMEVDMDASGPVDYDEFVRLMTEK